MRLLHFARAVPLIKRSPKRLDALFASISKLLLARLQAQNAALRLDALFASTSHTKERLFRKKSIDYEVLGQGGNMLMVTASGTAVVAQ